ncbi:hypothetical protein ACFQ2B_26045 [Streptomyces stramineus]
MTKVPLPEELRGRELGADAFDAYQLVEENGETALKKRDEKA